MKLPRHRTSALTLAEVLVALAILGILAMLALPAVSRCFATKSVAGALSKERSLYQATAMLSLESANAKSDLPEGSHMHWTTLYVNGKAIPTTAAMYFAALTKDNYLTLSELKKLLGADGKGPGMAAPTAQNSAFKFFVVDDASPDDQPLIVTANWNDRQLTSDAPYGKKGFVYFTKGGDGGVMTRPTDAASTNIFPISNGKKIYHLETLP